MMSCDWLNIAPLSKFLLSISILSFHFNFTSIMSRNSITALDKKVYLTLLYKARILLFLLNMSTARHIIQRARKRNGVISLVRGGANNVKIDTEIKHEV